jgi:sulfite dehydrogenase
VNLNVVDHALMWVTWIVAAVLVLMLLIGPRVIANDSGKPPPAGVNPYAGTASTVAPDGKALFASSCGSCHTLGAAGTNGQIGPKLDGLNIPASVVVATMKAGPGVMPSFSSLPPAERDAIAKFVAASSR